MRPGRKIDKASKRHQCPMCEFYTHPSATRCPHCGFKLGMKNVSLIYAPKDVPGQLKLPLTHDKDDA